GGVILPYDGGGKYSRWNMLGGTANVAAVSMGGPGTAASTGEWNIAGGTVVAGAVRMGTGGMSGQKMTINQSGGYLTITNTANGNYDGLLMGWAGVDGDFTFNQSGGTNDIKLWALLGRTVGGRSTYRMTGGALLVTNNWLYVGGSGGATGTLEIAGTSPSVNVWSYQQYASGTLKLTLGPDGGIRPIHSEIYGFLAGTLEIHTDGFRPEPNTVVTILNCNVNCMSGEFSQINYVWSKAGDVMSADVHYKVYASPWTHCALTLDHFRLVPKGTVIAVR
ncbi:MAG: hypothetical protein PHR35_01880, partial [Kiritimatiellae bacterium]|nr:hypothetical protein [Kiritimatiellia bacterium]